MLPQKFDCPPPAYSDISPGIQMLIPLDKLMINHDIEMLSRIPADFKHCNVIVDMLEEPLYYSQQIPRGSGMWTSFIFDKYGQVAFKISKVFDEVTVSCNDIKIGSVIKKFSLSPNFGIYNSNNKEVLKLKGSFLGMSLEHKLKLETLDGQEIGEIKNTCSIDQRTCLTNINYTATFPENLDVHCKAIILATMIIWDFDHSK
ncbi:hypothetical protein HCN44_003847 [Aphidius gifuensis]|uniref:Phospholipid scramblase n=1 Tax=Aphidius gifuensis TaxID=684658 RepID=A0A834XYD8_APHGI|nr:uncharacterized protein LOC122848129 [Aphidius gifuensis]KAF7994375.1 hypothetical protein HCN44_003847 [Aphidius gifuensis]